MKIYLIKYWRLIGFAAASLSLVNTLSLAGRYRSVSNIVTLIALALVLAAFNLQRRRSRNVRASRVFSWVRHKSKT